MSCPLTTGYKIANPTVLARISKDELPALMEGYGYATRVVTGSQPEEMRQRMTATLDEVVGETRAPQLRAREAGDATRPRWPMVIMRTPKGWTGPNEIDGVPVEGTFRAHQVPLARAPARDPSDVPDGTRDRRRASEAPRSSTRRRGCACPRQPCRSRAAR